MSMLTRLAFISMAIGGLVMGLCFLGAPVIYFFYGQAAMDAALSWFFGTFFAFAGLTLVLGFTAFILLVWTDETGL